MTSDKGTLAKSISAAIIFLAIFVVTAFVLSLIVLMLNYLGLISANTYSFLSQAVVLLSLSIAVFEYSFFYKRQALSQTLDGLGLSRAALSINAVWIGLLLFIIILLLELATSAYGNAINTAINTNAGVALAGAPLWFYIFVAVVEPINEEIMFRGFLVNRIGIIASAVIFGLLHASYDSTFAIEVIAALFFGLMAGYVFRKSGSLYPSIVTHIIVNSIAVLAILGAG